MAIKFKSDFDTSQNTDNSGASNNGPLLDNNGKKKRFSPVNIFLLVSVLSTFLMLVHTLAPIAILFVWLAMLLAVILVVFVPTIFTLGICWTSDGYRQFVANAYGMFLFLGQEGVQQEAMNFLSKSFWYVLFIGAAFTLIGLVWSIFEFNAEADGNRFKKRRMIGLIALAIIFTITSIFAGILLVGSQS